MNATIIENHGWQGQIELTLRDGSVAYALWTEDGDEVEWTLCDEGEAFALPETEEKFAGWERIVRRYRRDRP